MSCLIRETLGNARCKIAILANVFSSMQASNDLLQTVQIASQIFKNHRQAKDNIDNKVIKKNIINFKRILLEFKFA